VAAIRLIGSFGAGGVLYLTPMVFHQEAFSAGEVTGGFAASALVGTAARLLCGLLLQRGVNCTVPVLLAVVTALGGDAVLFGARTLGAYLAGQLLFGIAMGLYWPAIEMAVPLASPPQPAAAGFALARSADALGIAAGTLAGALLAGLGRMRGVYLVDMACLVAMAVLLLRAPLPDPPAGPETAAGHRRRRWLARLLPLLAIAVVATAMPALLQSALPLDLVRGGLARPPVSPAVGALTIGIQLVLLMVLQWPIGRALARRPVRQGLALSLWSLALGSLLLAASALVSWGMGILLAAQLPLAVGVAAFLPTATTAVVELTPAAQRGLAMALYSQCFAVSAFSAPLVAGRLLDRQDHAVGLWLGMAAACLLGQLLVTRIGGGPGAVQPFDSPAGGSGGRQDSWGRGSVPYSQSS
jgi:hypothetical protein